MKTNPNLLDIIGSLKELSYKNEAPIWKDVAKRLEKPTRTMPRVNVSKLTKYASEGETILIPGKLLGHGELKVGKLTVGAFQFSTSSLEKLKEGKCKAMTLLELAKSNPKGTGIRIMK